MPVPTARVIGDLTLPVIGVRLASMPAARWYQEQVPARSMETYAVLLKSPAGPTLAGTTEAAPAWTWHCTSSEKAGAIVAPVMRALSTARVVAAGAPMGGRIGEVVTGIARWWARPCEW